MITIASISKNRCNFEDLHRFADLLYRDHSLDERKKLRTDIDNYIWSVIEPYIKFIFVDPDDLLTVICENITNTFPDKNPDQFSFHTEESYSFPKRYMEIVYAYPLWKDYELNNTDNMNNVGSLYSLKHSVIENNCIVIANSYDLTKPKSLVMDSVTREDLLRMIRRRYLFTGVLISQNKMTKYYYQDPRYLIMKIYGMKETDNIEKLSVNCFGYHLNFYFQHDTSNYLNEIATRINGHYQLYGDILLLHEFEENVYANLSIHEVKRLNVLSYGRLYDRELRTEEIHTVPTINVDDKGKEIEKQVTPYWSKYIVVEARMQSWKINKNKCINCSQDMKNPIICTKCYRVKYCSDKCQREFSQYHYDECLH
jgi:hypothetical protein